MYLSFGLFFFWRISGTVVAVGVPDIFFALVGGLNQWFYKNNTEIEGLIAKSVTEKKQQQG